MAGAAQRGNGFVPPVSRVIFRVLDWNDDNSQSGSWGGPSVSDLRLGDPRGRPASLEAASLDNLKTLIEQAARHLPSQGPITVFVHHNTLRSLEDLPFDEAVLKGAAIYGCQPYLTEEVFRGELARGRILPEDLSAALLEDLGEDADHLIGHMGTRHHLRLAMLEHPLRLGGDAELRWLIAETDALRRFRAETPVEVRNQILDQTRRWIMRDYVARGADAKPRAEDAVTTLLSIFRGPGVERWTDEAWESFTLTLLWRICHKGVRAAERPAPIVPPLRHRNLLLTVSGRDSDLLVHGELIRFCGAFLDQGFAAWTLPDRDDGFFRAFFNLYRDSRPVEEWLRPLPEEIRRIEEAGLSPLQSIAESLRILGVAESDRGEYLSQSLLALRGWAGILWQMETNAEWAARPAPRGTLVEYLAIRLLLERLALSWSAKVFLGRSEELRRLKIVLGRQYPRQPSASIQQRAYLVFQLAQIRGWGPADLARLSKDEWARLVEEIESFGGVERRRIYQMAFERHYYNQVFNALVADRPAAGEPWRSVNPGEGEEEAGRPAFQVVCCLDEREESFRRHLEETVPECETFGVAGFFGVAMYYRGVAEAHFRPLCPVNIKPRHYVRETPPRSLENASRLQRAARRISGHLFHRLHLGSRTILGGFLMAMLGGLATIPLLTRVLIPRRTARLRRLLGKITTPPMTQLTLERGRAQPGPGNGHLGFTIIEMADIVENLLRSMGLTSGFARLVILMGHGSASLNNPQKAAYDCGACGGAKGGPNARAFARMANDPRVRRVLESRGLTIPDEARFLGAYHNTGDDDVSFFDLDDLPDSYEELLGRISDALLEVRKRNAHERCRRFGSAPLTMTTEEALRHVEARIADLSETRPELGHATNAVCVFGRRSRTRNLFMDRRAFLTSYDPMLDDDSGTILAGLLRAAVPVCAGINLEYYFSRVDNTGYGCGTKPPHNIASLLGVMDGAASDLRPGLPRQMIELHEPLRLLIIVEARPEVLSAVLEAENGVARLVRNGWVHLAALDPVRPRLHVHRNGRFEPFEPTGEAPPEVPSSIAWYRGWRGDLGFASIVPTAEPANSDDREPER